MTQDSRGKILLVDDDDLVLSALSLSLEDAGFAVVTANNGTLAVERVEAEPFDVVVCDIRMSGMDGIATLEAIKTQRPETRTVVITGYSDDPMTPVKAIELGVDDYLLKPFDGGLLIHRLERNIDSLRLQRENTRLTEELRLANDSLRRENRQLKQLLGEKELDILGLRTALSKKY